MIEIKSHKDIAKLLMKEILYDNGYVDRWHTEESQMSTTWEEKIAPIAGSFFDKYPELLTIEDIERIALGGIDGDDDEDLTVIYKNYYPDIEPLNLILSEYYEDGCGTL